MRVLVPTDYSEGSSFALAFASEQPGADILVLHVATSLDPSEQARLDAWISSAGIRARGLIRLGHAPEVIAETAVEEGCESIILHEGKFGFLGMGSTSKRVVGRSRVPVQVLRDDHPKHPLEMNLHAADV